ncbi:MAG: Lrp/AsnC family transcriptional regulator [Nitrososphaerota archaeon]|nr:Lrp/AsnC family transcriptional regulator [Nitrososphaerota archaeon]
MQKPETAARDTSYKTAELVKLISEIGPDIPEISRRLGQFKESVRYRYKEKVLGRGFGVQASIDHEKLGLRRVMFFADFGPQYKQYAHSILSAMNEMSYVVAFERRLFRGDYLVEASVPEEHVDAFVSFVNQLKELGLFVSLEIYPFDLFRTVPMRAEAYDFDTGRWDFDWSTPMQPHAVTDYRPTARIKLDKEDLLILKELQMDATRSFVEIADKLKVNYKMLAWHYKTHVLQRGMINGYYLRWMGTNYSTTLERALHRKHRYQHLALLAIGLTEMQRMALMGRTHGIPFLWNEMFGDGKYCANFYFPTENITEAYQFLSDAISDVKDKVLVLPLDQTEALAFTISYQLFGDKKKWEFNQAELVSRFGDLIQKIGEIGGT